MELSVSLEICPFISPSTHALTCLSAMCYLSTPEAAKALRLPRNVITNPTKCCACHNLHLGLTKRRACHAKLLSPKARIRANGPGPTPFLERPRTGVATEVGLNLPETPKPAADHSFSRFLFPRHPPTHVFLHAFILSSACLCAKLHSTYRSSF